MGPSPARTVGPAIASMLIYLLMAVVLYIRPSGLFPAKSVEVPPTLLLPASRPPQSALTTRHGLEALPIGIFLVFAALPVVAPLAGGEHLLSLGSRIMTPLAATWLVNRTGDEIAPAFLIMAAAAVTFATILRFRETYRAPFVGSPAAATAYA